MKIQNTSSEVFFRSIFRSEDNKQKEREWRKGREREKGKEWNRTWSRPESRNIVWHVGNEIGIRESKRQKKQNERVETGKKISNRQSRRVLEEQTLPGVRKSWFEK